MVGDAIARIVGQGGGIRGTVKDLAGDGVLALLGAPVAHEDDPERALLAALKIVEEMAEFADDVRGSWAIESFAVTVGGSFRGPCAHEIVIRPSSPMGKVGL